VQVNRPYATFCGCVDIKSGYAVIKVRSGQDIYVYGSVIDNATDDPIAIPMKDENGANRQWIAAAAHSDGAHGSVWRTDICLLNRSGETATAEIIFHRDNGENAALAVDLFGGQQIVVSDVVARLGMTGSGAIEIDSDGPLLASSRTYNAGAEGTFGLFLDGVPMDQMVEAGKTVWLPQLRQDEAFRTNIGLLNTGATTARVRIVLHDATGDQLAVKRKQLSPGSWLQLPEPFRRFADRNDIVAGYATVAVESGGGVIAYASVIDNATNDGTAISMKK
jgi:hypothetical protein